MFAKVSLIFLIINFVFAFNANLPYSAFNGCREYRIDGQYIYKDAFNIKNFRNNRPYDNEIFRMKFYVLTDRDANIMISNVEKVQDNEPVYEISKCCNLFKIYSNPNVFAKFSVLGAWNNTRSLIRRAKLADEVAEKQGPVLSALYPTEILVRLTKEGELTAILPGYDRPYLKYKDTKPSFWTYIGFSSWENTPSRWFYDCPLGVDGPGNSMDTFFDVEMRGSDRILV